MPQAKHLHILGICGTFMGGLAALAQSAGYRVTGCDHNIYPPMSDQLQALGIEVIEGYHADQLAVNADYWIIGNAISRSNPLLEALLDDHRPYTSGPAWLAEHILHDRQVLAVAGTHGKTTTATMLAWILHYHHIDCGYLIGGVPQALPGSAYLGSARQFVIEADEYDSAFCDKRAKFIHYKPHVAVLNNLEYDHADIYPDLAAIERQFHHLVRIVPRSGQVIYPADDVALQRVIDQGCWSQTITLPIANGAPCWPETVDVAQLSYIGQHNQRNAQAAIAAAQCLSELSMTQAFQALSHFPGVKRRLEVRSRAQDITVYDDFAHHPTAIAATLTALSEQLSSHQRLVAVVELRSNTMRLGSHRDRLANALKQADLAFVLARDMAWEVRDYLPATTAVFTNGDHLVAALKREVRPHDQVVMMSNGDFAGAIEQYIALLEH